MKFSSFLRKEESKATKRTIETLKGTQIPNLLSPESNNDLFIAHQIWNGFKSQKPI